MPVCIRLARLTVVSLWIAYYDAIALWTEKQMRSSVLIVNAEASPIIKGNFLAVDIQIWARIFPLMQIINDISAVQSCVLKAGLPVPSHCPAMPVA